MTKYPKIKTVWERDPATKHKTLIAGKYARDEFWYLADNEWVFTEKVDGTNIRIMWDGVGGVHFGGKTDKAEIYTPLLARLQEIVRGHRDMFDHPTCLYGEGYGARIQKGGGNYSPTPEFVLFDVKVESWWLRRADVENVANGLGIACVPIVGAGTLPDLVEIVRRGFSSTWGDFKAEGIVAKPAVPLFCRDGSRVIPKLKAKDFPQEEV